MKIKTIKAERRAKVGTHASRKLRKAGLLPLVIYGHGEPPESISASSFDVVTALGQGARIMKVEIGGKSEQFLIKEVQYDHFGETPVHLDLTRVSMHERVRVKVGIELRGTPKGVDEGGMLDQHLVNVEVECLPSDIPDTFHPLVLELCIGDSLLVKDLEIPANVTILADADERVATIRAAVEEAPEAEDGDGDGETKDEQPEVISRGRKDQEGEGDDAGKS